MEATILVVIALVMVGSAALLFGSRGAEGAVVSQPLPTSSPGSPGITIASASEDLTGAWMTVQGHEYVMFVSTAFGDNRLNVPLFVGQPGHWAAEVDALPTMPPWALDVGHQGLTWEPMVSQFGTRFVLYFAASVRKDSRIHCLGTAVSDSITGPYTPTPRPIVCQSSSGGDIDPQVVTDGGHPFLIWKMDANSVPPYTAPSRIFSQPLSADGLSVVGSPTVIYGTESAPPWARPIIEAPQMVASPFGGWWLFYSGGGGFFAPNYAIGVARCSSVTGPCSPVGGSPLLATNHQGVGPGEESFARIGGSDWLLYAPWHTGIPFQFFRPVEAVRIGWTSNGPYLAEDGSFPAP